MRIQQSNVADFIIPLSVKVYSGSMNGLMYKTDDSNTGKCRFKPVWSNFKPKLKDKSVQRCTALAQSFALKDSPCDYWAKNST